MTHATGVPCWMDLLTSDTARAREFYGRVFGWTAEEASPEFGGYFMFTVGGMPVAGCMPVQPGMDLADVWGVYLTSADAAGTLAAAVALGATTRFEPSPVADLGIQALLDDPSGARIGIWQPGMFAGFGPIGTGRPGTPAWFQLHATDYPGSVSFYRDAFGWTPQVMSDTDDFRLTAILDGEAGAGAAGAAGCRDHGRERPPGGGRQRPLGDLRLGRRRRQGAGHGLGTGRHDHPGGRRHAVRAVRGRARPDGRHLQRHRPHRLTRSCRWWIVGRTIGRGVKCENVSQPRRLTLEVTVQL